MRVIEEKKVREIGKVLVNVERPLKERFRALFSLKNIGGPVAIDCISSCFNDSSDLLKHELAYCLGQMQDETAIPVLIKVLEDNNQAPIVRHEAAEALGAIGSSSCLEVLQKYSSYNIREIAETCQLSLSRLSWLKDKTKYDSGEITSTNPYSSVDPAPPYEEVDVNVLKEILLNEQLPLFDRYRAMFSLRNLKTPESALALTEGLKGDGALFSHEVAFVLGQLQEEVTAPALMAGLRDVNKNEMVRHECAEALGAIATDDCFKILKEYLSDENRVVRESCEVALDMCEYENSIEFQYALT